MGLVDIDVIAKGGKKDYALKTFHKELKSQAELAKAFNVADKKKLIENVSNVFNMVDRIIALIGPNLIKRLRIFGHGSESTVQIGPFSYTGRRVEDLSQRRRIDQADLTKVIMITKTEIRTPDGRVVRTNYDLLNKGYQRGQVKGYPMQSRGALH